MICTYVSVAVHVHLYTFRPSLHVPNQTKIKLAKPNDNEHPTMYAFSAGGVPSFDERHVVDQAELLHAQPRNIRICRPS